MAVLFESNFNSINWFFQVMFVNLSKKGNVSLCCGLILLVWGEVGLSESSFPFHVTGGVSHHLLSL